MSDLIKYAALGVVGYVAYEFFIKPAMYPVLPAIPASSNIAPANSGANNITNVNIGILQKMFNAAGSNATLYSYDQWNYYYNKVTGSYGKSWEDTSLYSNQISRDKTMTAQQFLTVNAIDAMSGLGGSRYFLVA